MSRSVRSKLRVTAKDKPVLQLKVKGPGWKSGTIPVPELIKICEEAQNAINRQAEAIKGRKTSHPGPIAQAIQNECTLELIGVKKGSTTLQFGFAQPTKGQIEIVFEDLVAFGEEVVSELAGTIKALGNGKPPGQVDQGVLKSVYELTSIVGKRITEFNWIAPKVGQRKRIAAPINALVRERSAKQLSAPRRAPASVNGVLSMGDFKPTELKCRVDIPLGPSVNCAFDLSLRDRVLALLTKPVHVYGQGIFKPLTDKIDSLQIESIDPLPSLKLGEGDFFRAQSIADLAKQQAIHKTKDGRILEGGFPSDENVDDFLADIYGARK